MTGLVSIAPSSANVGALLGGAGMGVRESLAPQGGLGAIPFLELLGYFGDHSAMDEAQPESQSETDGAVFAVAVTVGIPLEAPRISPKQIADAVIRSMLKGAAPILTGSEGVQATLSDAAPPDSPAVAAIQSLATQSDDPSAPVEASRISPKHMLKGVEPVPTRREGIIRGEVEATLWDEAPLDLPAVQMTQSPVAQSEDWDVPLDWSAPEELIEFDQEADELPTWDSLPVAAVVEVAPSTPVPTPLAVEPDATSVPLRQPARAMAERIPSPVVSRPPSKEIEKAAPLAFAMKLSVIEHNGEQHGKVTKIEISSRGAAIASIPGVPLLPLDTEGGVHQVAANPVQSRSAVPATPNAVVLSLPSESMAAAPIESITPRPTLSWVWTAPLPHDSGKESRQIPAPNLAANVSAEEVSVVDVSADRKEMDQKEPDQRESKPSVAPKPEQTGEPKSWSRSESVMPAPMAMHATAVGTPVAVPAHAAGTSSGSREVQSAAAILLHPAAQPTEEPHQAVARSSSTHEIAIRISGPDAASVDLQVRERGGTVHVAVRTADGALQTSLCQDLGTLVDRLEQSGFHAETPAGQELPSKAHSEGPKAFDLTSAFRTHGIDQAMEHPGGTGAESEHKRDGDQAGQQNHSRGESGARQQHQQRRQNGSQQQQHLKWMQAMEDQA